MSDAPRVTITVLGNTPRRGRPRIVPEPSVPVSSRMTTTDYDRLVAAANRRGVSVAAFVRYTLVSALRKPGR